MVAEELAAAGPAVRLLSRRGTGPEHELIERVAGDASDASTVTRHAKGTDAIFNCANPAYHRWPTDWPPIANAILGAAEGSGASLVTLNNLYAYGQPNGPMTPHDPLSADVREGPSARHHVARRQARARRGPSPGHGSAGLGLHRSSVRELSRTSSSRASMNGQELSSDRQRRRAAQLELHRGRRAHVGDVRTRRPVLGPRVARPGESRALGASSHRRHRAASSVRRSVKITKVPTVALRVLGLFNTDMRELPKTLYQFQSAVHH